MPPKKRQSSENGEADSAKKAKKADEPKKNNTNSDFGEINFDSDAKTKTGEKWNFKITTW